MHKMYEIIEFEKVLTLHGIHRALQFLNLRTPHRFTGIYRYDGNMLRNEYLYDQFSSDVCRGQDVPMAEAYCAVVGQTQKTVEFEDIRNDGRFLIRSGSPVTSYCGVVILDEQGAPFGTLCHYDPKPCEQRVSDAPLLEAVAPLIFKTICARKKCAGERSSPLDGL